MKNILIKFQSIYKKFTRQKYQHNHHKYAQYLNVEQAIINNVLKN